MLAAIALEKGYRTIVAVGGDGTVYEVLNGILENDRLKYPIFYWGYGHGEQDVTLLDLLKLPREVDALIDLLKNGKPVTVYAGRSLKGSIGSFAAKEAQQSEKPLIVELYLCLSRPPSKIFDCPRRRKSLGHDSISYGISIFSLLTFDLTIN